jgi:hypothetical protein
MAHNDHEHLPAELVDVAHRLRAERPQATSLELDRIKLSAQAKSRRPVRRRQPFMKSRLVITTMLVAGLTVSGAGAGLAVSGISGSDNAGTAQYTTDTQTVLPTTETNTPTSTSETTPVQTTRQVSSNDSSQLPFTGYAAIPVLLAGIGLLGMGLVMRRRISSDRNQS